MQNMDCALFKESISTVNTDAHSPQEIQAAYYARNQAFEYIKKSYFGRALAHFFVALRLIPEWRHELYDAFWQALSGGCKQLTDEGRLDETVYLRKEALLLYPEDKIILLDLGSLYFKLHDIDNSLQYYEKALKVCPSLVPASRAIQSIHNKIVERWHFRMLNDLNRNRAYHRAISHRIHQGYSSVLDVGCGTGLLSLYAASEGAAEIWSCESNKYMFNIAQTVLAANNVSEKINLINESSMQLSVPSDIPNKISLLVTEVFDAGLLGEGILPSLVHAWKHLLLPPPHKTSHEQELTKKREHGVVVPFGATIYIAAVQCIDIARRHRLLPEKCFCKYTSNRPDSPYINFGETKRCKFCEAPSDGLTDNCEDIISFLDDTFVAADSSEPYTTEDLESIPFGFKFLSKPCKVLEINFNSLEELLAHSCYTRKGTTVPLLIDGAGSVDCIASWFHLNLDNNGTVITTAPFEESGLFQCKCWHQAIFPSFVPKRVSPGDIMSIDVDTCGGILTVCERGLDSWPQKVKEHKGLLARSLSDPLSVPVYFVSEPIVAFLNNRTWVKALTATAADLILYFGHTSVLSKQILDLNPFPILGLRMLKGSDPSWKLIAKAETKVDEEYIKAVAKKNNIGVEQIYFVTDKMLEERIQNEQFDVVNMNVVDPSGEVAEHLVDTLPLILGRLTSNGVMVPNSLSIECQLIESDKLKQDSHVVSNENVGSFIIKSFINGYAVDYHLHIAPHGLKLRTLSDRCEVIKVQMDSLGQDGICCEHRGEVLIDSTETGSVTGVLYWMNLFLRPGSIPISTMCYDSHCNQAALFSSISVVPGTKVTGKYQLWYGILDLQLLNVES